MAIVDDIRRACDRVSARARHVAVAEDAIAGYAAALPLAAAGRPALDPEAHLLDGPSADRAAFTLQLDAVNFGSGWFPTLRRRPGRSGYFTVAIGLCERAAAAGPWSSAELRGLAAGELADVLGQDPAHPLMRWFAESLHDLGAHVQDEAGGDWLALVEEAGGSAVALVERLAGWACFADTSNYDGRRVPFLKRAQLAAADLELAGVARFADLARLTLFADNLVPHVLRLDGVLRYDPTLLARIDRGDLLEHGSPEEVEIRACALHAVELIVAARDDGTTAAQVDHLLWNRGQEPQYKAVPRHRARCRAY